MSRICLCLALVGLFNSPAQAQQTATYGTLVTSLNTTSTGAITGTAYAVPSSYAALIQWVVVADGSALSANLMCSLDNVSYFVVDTQTTAAGGSKQFGFTACKFIRIDAVSRTGGTGTVGTLVISRGFITSGSAGNLSSITLSPGPLTINQGTLTTNTQAITSTATWNNAAVTFTHWKTNIIDTTSNSASLLLDLQVGGVSQFSVTKGGLVSSSTFSASNRYTLASSGDIFWTSRSNILSPADGQILLRNNAGTDFSRLQFGGTTSSFPSLKRSTTFLQARLADDSAYTFFMGGLFTAGTITVVSNTSANSCGTTAAVMSTGSNDNSGSFTVGATSGTSCTITFNVAATNRRDCTANNETTANLARVVYVNTTTSKVEGNFVGADVITYTCFAR